MIVFCYHCLSVVYCYHTQSTPHMSTATVPVAKLHSGIMPTYDVDVPVFDKGISEKLDCIIEDFSNSVSSSVTSPVPCARSRSMEEEYDASPDHVGELSHSAANRPTNGYYRSRYVQAVLGPDRDIGWIV